MRTVAGERLAASRLRRKLLDSMPMSPPLTVTGTGWGLGRVAVGIGRTPVHVSCRVALCQRAASRYRVELNSISASTGPRTRYDTSAGTCPRVRPRGGGSHRLSAL